MKVFDILNEKQDAPTMGLTIFDIDDTLFHTTAKIKVINNGQVVRTLSNQEFNNYQLQPGEEFDFGEFRSAEKFAKESEPIKPMINTLKRILDRAANTKVIMLTARADFDDKDKFLNTFEKYGIDMSRVHVHRAGNLPGDETPAHKKAVWVRRYLNTGKYNRVNLIDDSMSNLRVFKSLEKEYPQIDFDAYFVKPSGSVQTVSEGRRRKNKRRSGNSLFSRNTGGVWGAWGPGAFGGYGQDSGYSGGSGDGGGGESRVIEKIGDVSQFAEVGDTVYSIARQNNIDPTVLMKLNGFNKGTKLKAGQEVKLPNELSKNQPPIKKIEPAKSATQPATQPAPSVTPPKITTKSGYAGPITSSPLETTLRSVAIQAGLKGQELAQFLAQCAHETGNFSSLTEYGGSLDFRKYDPKYAPKKAKELGNVRPGDGALFKGRGFIQLTGRWNYTEAGKALGLPLDKNPKLVERPDIAAKTSLWFWKNRVRPNVDNFSDTKSVTYYINKALRGLDERIEFFKKYLSTMGNVRREDVNDTEEDYHPNEKPAGPESKPTMPAGTVRVDVSDVYDWYKLGQHVSNLKGLGKHDFGKGPPSTIMSFGSEEEEHKYIKDLEKTGLSTTDIDPVDPKQPKGMRRQKVDPNYNVGENTDHSNNDQAVSELKAALLAHKSQIQNANDDEVYDIIDKMMTRIAKSHSISGKKLHDMWVKKYKLIPDTWVMKENIAPGDRLFGGWPINEDNLIELNVSQTLQFIQQAHGDQLYGKLPYWHHPRAVAMTGRKIFGKKFTSDAVKTAFLHDVVEDTHIGLDELSKLDFSPQVIEAVGLLTKNKSMTYAQNIQNIIDSGNPLAMMVKYSDNYENFSGDKSDWDPKRAASSQKKYLMSLNMLGDHLGVKHHLGENFADGRNPQDKGDSARHGIKKGSSISDLKKIRSSDSASARKKQLAHWQINMRQGKK